MADARARAFLDGFEIYLLGGKEHVLRYSTPVAETLSPDATLDPSLTITFEQGMDLYRALGRELGEVGPEGRALQSILSREQDRVDFLIGRNT